MNSSLFLEISAVVLGTIYVIAAMFEKRWCWYFGIASSIFAIIFAYESRYYQDIIINTYYVVAGLWGLAKWSSHASSKEVIHNQQLTHNLIIPFGGILAVLLLGFLFSKIDNSKSYLDAFTTIFAFIATWLTVKKVIENWLYWVVIDLVSFYMYFSKELYVYSTLYMIYAFFAVLGYIIWQRKMKLQHA